MSILTKMMNKNKIVILVLVCSMSLLMAGCDKFDQLKVKMGIKNMDFEYIKQNKIQKIIIQNTRDQGFRFIVTDKNAISELYDILSSAKEVKEKSSLEPDYIFEMYEGHDKVHKFKYIAGIDKKNGGNLYGDDKVYIVSKRIDNDIIKSFWTIRKPKDFTDVYYSSLLKVLDSYIKESKTDKKVSINLNDDIESAKFLLSYDLEEFKIKLNDNFKNVELLNKESNDYEILMTVKTEGYKSTLYKAIVTFYDRKEKSEKKYYIKNEYENRSWKFNISTKKSEDF